MCPGKFFGINRMPTTERRIRVFTIKIFLRATPLPPITLPQFFFLIQHKIPKHNDSRDKEVRNCNTIRQTSRYLYGGHHYRLHRYMVDLMNPDPSSNKFLIQRKTTRWVGCVSCFRTWSSFFVHICRFTKERIQNLSHFTRCTHKTSNLYRLPISIVCICFGR